MIFSSTIGGGLAIFGVLFAIGIIELYVVKKAYQSKALKQGIGAQSSNSHKCKGAGGRWTGTCCRNPEYEVSLPMC